MQVFRARLRRVGNSLGVIVPKRVAEDADAHEGEEVEVAIIPSAEKRRRLLHELIGSAPDLPPFKRERDDRY